MALEARVRDAYRLPSVTAFGGREYVKVAWRPVPDEQAGSAGAHSFLEVREVGGGTVSQEPSPVADVVDAPPTPPPSEERDAPSKAAPTRRGKS